VRVDAFNVAIVSVVMLNVVAPHGTVNIQESGRNVMKLFTFVVS
jgi:hypothetical protein